MKTKRTRTTPREQGIEPSRILAAEVMRTDLLVLRADDPVRTAAEQLEDAGISGAPVVDESGRLLGVLTLRDIARSEHVQDEGLVARMDDEGRPERASWEDDAEGELQPTTASRARLTGTARVVDWMSPGVTSVAPDATLGEVCRTLVDEGIHRVFVLERHMLRGVISAQDIVALLATPPGAGKSR